MNQKTARFIWPVHRDSKGVMHPDAAVLQGFYPYGKKRVSLGREKCPIGIAVCNLLVGVSPWETNLAASWLLRFITRRQGPWNADLRTPPGPEGSNGSLLCIRRGHPGIFDFQFGEYRSSNPEGEVAC